MKIENKILNNSLDKIKKSPKEISEKTKSSSSETQSSSSAEKTSLIDSLSKSPELQELEDIKIMVKNHPDEREERIQTLKKQFESGNYNVNNEDLADKILNELT